MILIVFASGNEVLASQRQRVQDVYDAAVCWERFSQRQAKSRLTAMNLKSVSLLI